MEVLVLQVPLYFPLYFHWRYEVYPTDPGLISLELSDFISPACFTHHNRSEDLLLLQSAEANGEPTIFKYFNSSNDYRNFHNHLLQFVLDKRASLGNQPYCNNINASQSLSTVSFSHCCMSWFKAFYMWQIDYEKISCNETGKFNITSK